jgi:N-acetylglucosamine-6-sulfatase
MGSPSRGGEREVTKRNSNQGGVGVGLHSKALTMLKNVGGGLLLALVVIAGCMAASARGQEAAAPNIIVIGTDDNNAETLYQAMPNVVNRIGDEGATFENFTYAQSLCCPNRAATQRGQYTHNTGIYGNEGTHGGFSYFLAHDEQKDTLGRTIDEAGYNTAYVGKYMNGYEDYFGVVPTGWDIWYSGRPPGTCFSANGEKRCSKKYDRQPHDRFMVDKALPIIQGWDGTAGPDMMFLSLYNPHSPCEHPAAYDDMFGNAALTSPSYNEPDVSDKPRWVARQDRFTSDEKRLLVQHYRCRLRAAAFTDNLIGQVLDAVDANGEPTYVIFWNDNGWLNGEHRIASKNDPYIEAERFPLFVRGPQIAPGTTDSHMVGTVDIRPTLEDIAGAASPDYEDGSSFLPLAQGQEIPWRQYAYGENLKVDTRAGNTNLLSIGTIPRWQAVYTAVGAYHYYPDTGEEEFYSLGADPFELDGTIAPDEQAQIGGYRDALAAFEGCAKATCRIAEEATP